jgi:hypothetical protein
MSKSALQSWRWVAIALAGPVVTGAVLGLRAGAGAMAVFALGLPVVVAAVTLLTTPTLYVGGAVLGGRLSLSEVLAATAHSLHGLGLALLGLAPLNLLLVATLPAATGVPLRGVLLLVLGLFVGLHRLATELDARMGEGPRPNLLERPVAERVAPRLLFTGHALVALIIGARLFHDLDRLALGVAS